MYYNEGYTQYSKLTIHFTYQMRVCLTVQNRAIYVTKINEMISIVNACWTTYTLLRPSSLQIIHLCTRKSQIDIKVCGLATYLIKYPHIKNCEIVLSVEVGTSSHVIVVCFCSITYPGWITFRYFLYVLVCHHLILFTKY